MKKTIMETLVLAAFAVGQAQAAPLPLDHATITASYQGAASGVLGLDTNFQPGPGSNTSKLDPLDSGVEFLTADALFGVDFSKTGLLTVYNNAPLPEPGATPASYVLRFDFGSTLSAPIASFALVDGSMVGGLPGLSVVDGHTIGVDLGQLTWNGDFAFFTAQLGAADADLPEPASLVLLLGGVAGLIGSRRHVKRR